MKGDIGVIGLAVMGQNLILNMNIADLRLSPTTGQSVKWTNF